MVLAMGIKNEWGHKPLIREKKGENKSVKGRKRGKRVIE